MFIVSSRHHSSPLVSAKRCPPVNCKKNMYPVFALGKKIYSPCGSRLYRLVAFQTQKAKVPGDGGGLRGSGFKIRLCHMVFPFGKEINRHCQVAYFSGNAHYAELSLLFAHRARPTPLECKNEYLVLALMEETAVQAAVGCIVWAFCRLKCQRAGS